MVKVLFGTIEADIDDGNIVTRPAFFTEALQQAAEMEPKSGADPDQDLAIAERLSARFDGRIVEVGALLNGSPGEVN